MSNEKMKQMAKSYLTNIHKRKIITKNVIFRNLYMSKYAR